MDGGKGAECALGNKGNEGDEKDHAGEEGDPENADGFSHSIRAITSKIGNSRQESEKIRLKNAFFYPVHK